LQIFQKSQLDLAVIDIFLQDVMTGIELIGLLRERDPTLPIIISGPMALDSCDEYFGHVKRLSKPLRPAELMLAIDTAMRSMLR
jgi:CheY-like chemotaxis protein